MARRAKAMASFHGWHFFPSISSPGSTLTQPGREEWGEVGVTHHRSRRARTPHRTRGQRAPPWPLSWPLAASSLQRREGTRLARCRDLPTAANAGRGMEDSCSSTESCLYENVSCSKRLEISFVPSPSTCLKTRLLKAFAFLLQHHMGCEEAAGEHRRADTCVFKINIKNTEMRFPPPRLWLQNWKKCQHYSKHQVGNLS